LMMFVFSNSSLNHLLNIVLALIVLMVWGFVIYAGYFVSINQIQEAFLRNQQQPPLA